MRRPLDPPAIPNATFVRHLGSGGFADEAWVAFGCPFSHKTARTCGPTAAGEACADGETCTDADCDDSSGSELTWRA